jgi:hypothetical protein
MALTADNLLKASEPRQCAFANALPVTRDDFFTEIAKNSDKDFVKGMTKGRRPEIVWKEDYKPIIHKLKKVFASAKQAGMKVIEKAGLCDLSEAFANYQIITIFAHWRGHELKSQDVKAKPATIAKHILEANDEVGISLRKGIDLRQLEIIAADQNNWNAKSQLAKLINGVIVSNRPVIPLTKFHPSTILIVEDLWLAFFNRNTIDSWMPGAFNPGNRLELSDGLHSIGDIKDAIPASFAGIIDFSICRSDLLADYIKSGYPQRRIITGQSQIHPVGRLIIQEELIRRLDADGGNYAVLLFDIYKDIVQIRPSILKKGLLSKALYLFKTE